MIQVGVINIFDKLMYTDEKFDKSQAWLWALSFLYIPITSSMLLISRIHLLGSISPNLLHTNGWSLWQTLNVEMWKWMWNVENKAVQGYVLVEEEDD